VCMCSGIFVHLGVVTLQITSVVGPNRDRLDACLVFPSMPAVMKLNKLGTFSMAQLGQSKSIIGDFIKSARKVRVVWESCALLQLGTMCACIWSYLDTRLSLYACVFLVLTRHWIWTPGTRVFARESCVFTLAAGAVCFLTHILCWRDLVNNTTLFFLNFCT